MNEWEESLDKVDYDFLIFLQKVVNAAINKKTASFRSDE